MSYDIVTGRFCADYFSSFDVPSSDGKKTYRVTLNGGEGMPSCTCKAWEFFKGPIYDRTCKHIDHVWKHACLWNEQWCDGFADDLDPVEGSMHYVTIPDEECPHCHGPVCPVKIAV